MSQRNNGAAVVDMLIGVAIAAAIGVGVYVTMTMDKTGRRGGALGRQYEKRAKELEKIDPSLFIYDEDASAKISTGMAKALAVAVGPDDAIYVAGDGKVKIYGADGAATGEIDLGRPALCLTVAADGTLFVGFKDQVVLYGKDGRQRQAWGTLGEKARLSSIAVSGDAVFVADAGLRTVHHYTRAGKPVGRIGDPDAGLNTHWKIPSPYFDLAISGDGVLSIVNPGVHRIETFALDRQPRTSFGRYGQDVEGFCGCCNPVNLALLPDGGYVTSEKGLVRIKVLDNEGKLVGVVAGAEQFATERRVCASKDKVGDCNEGGLDIAVDSKGRVLALDPYTGEVRVFIRKKSS